MNFTQALQIFIGLLATPTSSFTPSNNKLSSTSIRQLPSLFASASSTVSHSDTNYPIIDIPPLPSISCDGSSCDVEALDEEMDSFADKNDRRYSASDWLHSMQSLPDSGILSEIKGPVGWITAWSTLVSIIHKVCYTGKFGDVASQIASNLCVGSAPHSLIASSLGLLLVFRTNSAYQRFKVSI